METRGHALERDLAALGDDAEGQGNQHHDAEPYGGVAELPIRPLRATVSLPTEASSPVNAPIRTRSS